MESLKEFFQQFSLAAVTHSVAMKIGAAAQTVTVKAMVKVRMPRELEGEISGGHSSICLVLDSSASTAHPLKAESRDDKIYKAILSGALDIIGGAQENDQIAVVSFNSSASILSPLTACTPAGKEEVIAAIESGYFPSGGTNYSAGLQAAMSALQFAEGKKVIIFVSDGEHLTDYPDPTKGSPSLCDIIRDSGIAVYTAAVSDNLSAADENRLKEMSGGQNFMAATTAAEVGKYFLTALSKSERAAVTNAQLVFSPIGLVQAVNHFELVQRNGNRSYVAGTIAKRTEGSFAAGLVQLGEIAPGDELDCYVEFETRLPSFQPDVSEQIRTFGELTLQGMIPALNVTEVTDFVTDDMRQRFAVDTPGTTNKAVDNLYGLATAARALNDFSQTTDDATQQEIIKKAEDKVRRATQVFSDDDDTEALDAALADLTNLKESKGTAAQKAKDAGRKTIIFTDDDDEVPAEAVA